MKINITIPIKINDDLIKYDPTSDYYNNICSKTTSIYSTDISLVDRKNNFMNNNMFICEEDCKIIDYDYINEKSQCSCLIKQRMPSFEEVKFNKEKFYNNFKNIKNLVNLNLMKCYKNIFIIADLKKNYGFFIFILMIILHILYFILFYCKLASFFKKVENIISLLNNYKIKLSLKKNMKFIKEENKIEDASEQEGNKNQIINPKIINIDMKIEKNSFPPRKSIIKNKQRKKRIINNNNLSNYIPNDIFNSNNNINEKKLIEYKENELNELSYKDALKNDKRTCSQYYISLVKTKHIFVFSFIYKNDYNSRIIKMALFFFQFAVHFTINTLFFNDKTIHKIYEDEGYYNFIYQIPQIIYSSLLSGVLNALVKFLALSEKDILKFRKKEKDEKFEEKRKKLFINLKVKFALFFIISFLLLLIFGFYVSCFCGIYFNTQIHLIKDSVISFSLSFLYPFGLYLLPCIFRIPALKNKNSEYLYKLSKLFQML